MFEQKIKALQEVKNQLLSNSESLKRAQISAQVKNAWFTQESISNSLNAIIHEFLDEANLKQWLSDYPDRAVVQTVGLIPAGNIPLVGFHDLLCCFVTHAPTLLRLSSKDEPLMKHMVDLLQKMDSNWNVQIVERLKGFDKVIATGSNNTHRYFEQYFSKVPSLLRKNRKSIGVVSKDTSKEELTLLADDIFPYFGLGCRNVSMIWLPKGFDVTTLFDAFQNYTHYHDHKTYMDNYDYNRTLLLMNQTEHLANEFIMLVPEDSLHARIGTLHYKFYSSDDEVQDFIINNNESIQCVVSAATKKWANVPFGKAQSPALWDWPDGADVLSFLYQ